MTSWPRISIVTPSYNQAAYLEETLDSVLGQGYPNLEYIVIDGGSTDGSADILRRHAAHLTYWCSEPDRGQADALNKGFSRATGDMLGFLNSDDVYRSGALHRVAAEYHRDERSAFWVCFPVEDFDENGPRSTFLQRTSHELVDWMIGSAYLHQPGVFWSRSLHLEVGGLDPSFHFAFDRKFFMELLLRGHDFRPVTGPAIVGFRVHLDSKTGRDATTGAWFAEDQQRIVDDLAPRLTGRHRRNWKRWERQRALSAAAVWPRGEARLEMAGRLARVVRAWPSSVLTRFYWGAWKRVLVSKA